MNTTTEYEGRVEVCLECGEQNTVICTGFDFNYTLHAGLLCNNMFYLLQYWNTTVLTRCLEMVDVQFFIIFDAVGVNQTLDYAAKTDIHTPIAVEDQSLE